jgi:hypothetical protein
MDPNNCSRRNDQAIMVPGFSPLCGGFPNVDKSLGPEAAFAVRSGARGMKSTASLPAGGRAIYFIKDLKDPFCHCEARLSGPWQRRVYGEQSMYLSR